MASLLFSGLRAIEAKRHPKVETLLVARRNHTEGIKKVSDWITGGG